MKSFRLSGKCCAVFTALGVMVLLAGCGSSSSTANPNSVTGNWKIQLFSSNNEAIYVFTTKLNQEIASPSTTSPITGSNLTFTTNLADTCFKADSSSSQTGVYTVSGNFNGLTTNTVQLTIEGSPGTMIITGPFTTRGISGPWSLTTTGTGCEAAGTFLMTRS